MYTLTTIDSDYKSTNKQHFVRVGHLGEPHEASPADAEHVVEQ